MFHLGLTSIDHRDENSFGLRSEIWHRHNHSEYHLSESSGNNWVIDVGPLTNRPSVDNLGDFQVGYTVRRVGRFKDYNRADAIVGKLLGVDSNQYFRPHENLHILWRHS